MFGNGKRLPSVIGYFLEHISNNSSFILSFSPNCDLV